VAVHRSGSLDSSASGASSVNAATDTAKLRLLGAWCGKTMHEAEPGGENGSVSHGICDSCADRERAKGQATGRTGFVPWRSSRSAMGDQNEKLKPVTDSDDGKRPT